MNKQQLRDNLLNQRKDLSIALQKQKSADIYKHIVSCSVFDNATHIATYYPVKGEANPGVRHPILGKHLFLPVISTEKNQGLLFAPFHDETRFDFNQFSIPEPIYNDNDLRPAASLDLVLVPLLGFDKNGNRLGMGGGFYDRTFSFKLNPNDTPPILMGIAYDFQEIPKLATEPWDVPLDYIVTESRLLKINR